MADPLAEALAGGSLHIWVEGEELRGGYRFVHARVGGEEDDWLLVKVDDDEADARRNPVSTEPDSVLSGRSIADLQDEGGAVAERE